VHNNALNKGFWKEATSLEHFLTLVVSEAIEAMECFRSNQSVTEVDPTLLKTLKECVDGKSPLSTASYEILFKTFLKETFQMEMADIAIRVLDLMGFQEDSIGAKFGTIYPDIDLSAEYYGKSFTEQTWIFINSVVYTKNPESIMKHLVSWWNVVPQCSDLCFYIEAKILYNSSRPYLHNKKF
jgi:NTP pyrophosphatase (non-canonical NTP hydrolase)